MSILMIFILDILRIEVFKFLNLQLYIKDEFNWGGRSSQGAHPINLGLNPSLA